jgi:dipeptidyl aminopeptidase/acylaminoacyl peptidase
MTFSKISPGKASPDIETLLSVPHVSSFDISRSGDAELVYCTNRSGQWQLHIARLWSELEHSQLTHGEESSTDPVFTPDGKCVLFARDTGGDEKFDLFLLNLSKGQVENLTPGTDFSIYPDVQFSSDGRKLSFVSDESGRFSAHLLDLGQREKRRITDHKYSDLEAKVSPDGRMVAVSSLTSRQDSCIFLASVEREGHQLRVLGEGVSQTPLEASEPAWSPDSRALAFVSASRGYRDVGIWSIESDGVRWLTETQREHYSPVFSHDGRKLAYLMNSGSDIVLVVHDLRSDRVEVIDFMPGEVYSPLFTPSDDGIAFIFSGPRNPPDVWLYSFRKREFRQVTKSIPPSLDMQSFSEGEPLRYRCLKDGSEVPALLHRPRGQKKGRPQGAVIHIHGGPSSQALNGWDPVVQSLVSRGFVVLRPNYRGSTGFGKKFMEANRFVMGDLDLADCVSGWDFLVQSGLADPSRIAVYGGSFGGYLTMCALTKYPERWACGVAIVPFLNWFTEIQNEREDLRYWDLENMGDPSKDAERLRDASPIFFIDRVRAPVFLAAGANDPRCPAEEVEQARNELKRLGKRLEVKFYPDEGHGFRKMKNRVDALKSALSFLERYLG